MRDVKNKVVVITGAANGLGKALAIEYYMLGSNLALIDIDLKGLESLKAELINKEQQISIHKTDVSQEHEVLMCKEEIITIHKRVDVLINNAAVSISQYFYQLNMPDYKRVLDVNFWGAVYCTSYFLPELKKQNNSHLINIISDFALMGFPAKTAYASSKSALMGFTNSLKTELDPHEVLVTLVIPPPLDTDIVTSGKHIDQRKQYREYEFLKRHSMPIDNAARIIVSGIRRGKYRIVVGSMMFWSDLMCRLFPTLVHKFINRNKKWVDFV